VSGPVDLTKPHITTAHMVWSHRPIGHPPAIHPEADIALIHHKAQMRPSTYGPRVWSNEPDRGLRIRGASRKPGRGVSFAGAESPLTRRGGPGKRHHINRGDCVLEFHPGRKGRSPPLIHADW
jgi:hypothetical protein